MIRSVKLGRMELKSRGPQSYVPFGHPRGIPVPQLLEAAPVFLAHSPSSNDNTPISVFITALSLPLFPSSHHLLWLWHSWLPLINAPCLHWVHLDILGYSSHLKILNLITPARSLSHVSKHSQVSKFWPRHWCGGREEYLYSAYHTRLHHLPVCSYQNCKNGVRK